MEMTMLSNKIIVFYGGEKMKIDLFLATIIPFLTSIWIVSECYDKRSRDMQGPGVYFGFGGIIGVVLIWMVILFF